MNCVSCGHKMYGTEPEGQAVCAVCALAWPAIDEQDQLKTQPVVTDENNKENENHGRQC